MDAELVSIVDSSDAVVGAARRDEMRAGALIHRAAHILVFNAAGEILAQRRADGKDLYPGRLDLAAGGVVRDGETYEHSAARELAEELGVSPPLICCFDLWFEDAAREPANRSWGRVFACVCDGPFTLQESEVVAANFIAVADALALDVAETAPDSRQALLAYHLQPPSS
ncbi:MAG: NUDIX hydrolase [bacterium]